jgi:hypothetical protein
VTAVSANRTGRKVRSEAEKLQAEAEALRELRAHLTVSTTTGGNALGVGRDRMRVAVERGDIPSIRVAGETRIASAVLLGLLGLMPEPKPGAAPVAEEDSS